MKKFHLFAILSIALFCNNQLLAQTNPAPEGIIFQAVATDPQGNPAAGRTIYIKDAILQSSVNGQTVYSETFKVTASSTGVFTIVIGKGQNLTGPNSISSLDWSAGPYFLNLKAAVAPSLPLANWNADQQYIDMGTSQFWSVPIALYASKVAGFDLKLNISDTTNMLKSYLRKSDTASLSNRIDVVNTAVVNEVIRAKATELLKSNTVDVNFSLSTKENSSNKSTNTILGTSDILYPSQNAVKTYVDATVSTATPDATNQIKGKLQLAGDLSGTAAAPTVPGLSLKANTIDVTVGLALKADQASLESTNTTVASNKASADATATSLTTLTGTVTSNKTAADATATSLTTLTGTVTSNKTATDATATSLTTLTGTVTSNKTATDAAILLKSNQTALDATNAAVILKADAAATATALGLKEEKGNKSIDITTDALSETKYPSVKSVKTYVDAQIASATIVDANAVTKGKIQLAGDLSGTAAAPTVPGLTLKANASEVTAALALKADQTALDATNAAVILKADAAATATALGLKEEKGNKSIDITTDAVSDTKYPSVKSVKTYVDAQIASATIADADAATKGKIQLAGDLGGSGSSAAAPVISDNAVTTVKILDANVTTAKIADANVTTAKIADANISTEKIADAAVTNEKLAGGIDLTNKVSGILPIANGGTGSSTQNFVDVTTAQTISGTKTFNDYLSIASTTNSSSSTSGALTVAGGAGVAFNLNVGGNVNAPLYSSTPVALSAGSTIIWTPTNGLNASVTLDQASELSFATTPPDGSSGTLIITQPASGSTFGLTLPTVPGKINKVLGSSTGINLSAVNGASDILTFYYDGSNFYWNIGLGYGNDQAVNASNLSGGTAGSIPYQSAAGTTGYSTAGTAGQFLISGGTGVPTWTTNTGAVPYTGATGAVNLGPYDLLVNSVIVGSPGNPSNQNTRLGSSSFGYSSDAGANNTGLGFYTLATNNGGTDNTAVGSNAIRQGGSGTGSFNTAVGSTVLTNGADGNENTAVGYRALVTIETGSKNTAIGSGADVGSNDLTNATAIGAGAIVTANNTIQLGNTNVTNVTTSGIINAGTITYPNSHNSIDGQVLTVNATGVASWQVPSATVHEVADEFSATATQTSFILSQAPSANSKIKMYVNGIRISNTAYSISGTTLTYDATKNGAYALSVNDRIQFDYYY